jgi:hypothetical protein
MLCVAMLVAACAPRRLFDGRTLEGWTQRGGKASYTVEDGCIVGATRPDQPNSFLCTNEVYRDFVLELEFRADPEVNSGVQIRSLSLPENRGGVVHGYQVEIDTTARAWTGGIYDESRRGWLAPLDKNPEAQKAYRHGEWNRFRIEARGDRIRTWVNGVAAADLRDSMTAEGFIALQVHGVGKRAEPLTIRFRTIELRRLD